MMDRFPEAFRRFERVVDIDSLETYRNFRYAFSRWAGKRWRNTWAQNRALARIGRRLGFKDVGMPRLFGFTVETEKRMKAVRKAKRVRRVRKKWVKAVKSGKYRGVGKVRANALNWYIRRGYSANKIQRRMKDRGLGVRRKTLLKIVREMKLKPKKADVKKYIPRKYRKKRK